MLRRSRRRGYTLLEVCLVAAIMVIIAALAVPTLQSWYGYYKLQGAVDSVKAAWANARARAVEEGRPYRFSVEPSGGRFRVAPDQSNYWSGGGTNSDDQQKAFILEKAMPPGVRFGVNGQDATPTDDSSTAAKDQDNQKLDPGSYTTTAVFLPDGTAKEDVTIVFRIKGATPTQITLRAMTGSVTTRKLTQ